MNAILTIYEKIKLYLTRKNKQTSDCKQMKITLRIVKQTNIHKYHFYYYLMYNQQQRQNDSCIDLTLNGKWPEKTCNYKHLWLSLILFKWVVSHVHCSCTFATVVKVLFGAFTIFLAFDGDLGSAAALSFFPAVLAAVFWAGCFFGLAAAFLAMAGFLVTAGFRATTVVFSAFASFFEWTNEARCTLHLVLVGLSITWIVNLL